MRLPARGRPPRADLLSSPGDPRQIRGILGADVALMGVLLALAAGAAVADLHMVAVAGALAAGVVGLASLLSASGPMTAGFPAVVGLLAFATLLGLHSFDEVAPRLWTSGLAVPAAIAVGVMVTRHWSRTRFASQMENTRARTAIAAREQERGRWARNLHDDTLQQLSAMRMMLTAAGRNPDRVAVQDVMRDVTKLIEDQIVGLRHMLTDLRPLSLDELGLGPALESLAQRSEALFPPSVRLDVPSADQLAVASEQAPPAVQEAVYRVVQEALANAGKHAGATTVDVRLRTAADRVTAEIVDDGVGFSPRSVRAGFGISSMIERVDALHGRLEIRSRPGDGTTVVVTIPTAVRVTPVPGNDADAGHDGAPSGGAPADHRSSARVFDRMMRRSRFAAALVVLVQGSIIVADVEPPYPVPLAATVFAGAIVAVNLLLPATQGSRTTWGEGAALVHVLADALLTLAAVGYMQFDAESPTWIGMVVVVGEAAWRLPLRAAVVVWLVLTSAYLGILRAAVVHYARSPIAPEAFVLVAVLTLAVTLIVSTTRHRTANPA